MKLRCVPQPHSSTSTRFDAIITLQAAQSPAKLAKIQASAERQQKKQKRKAEEGQLQVKRHEMDKAKVWRLNFPSDFPQLNVL